METKFKVGDKVLITKPTEIISSSLSWVEEMDKFNGRVFEISSTAFIDIWTPPRYGIKESPYIFAESWLTKVDKRIITEEPKSKEIKPIDWEYRRWDLYKMFLVHYSEYSIEEALITADRCVEFYKQKKQN